MTFMDGKDLWGVDLGGTKIEVAVIEPHSKQALTRLRVPTEAHLGYPHILGQIEKVIQMAEAESGQSRASRIGVCTPGALDPHTKLLRNSNTTCLIGKPLKEDLDQLLGAETTLANDANCFALAEARLGAGRGHEVVFGIIMGTGVGGGVVIRGSVIEGANGIAGEWGHNLLDPNGVRCYCGRVGCVETVLSGPAIARRHREAFGENLALKEISQRAAEGDAHCKHTIAETCQWFGRALGPVVNILDPNFIVLGGGVSNLPDLYTLGYAALLPYEFHEQPKTKVIKAELGDSAGVFGAAMLTSSQ